LLSVTEAAAMISDMGNIRRLAGDGAAAIAACCPDGISVSHPDLLPDAAHLAALAAMRVAGGASLIAPLYLRAPDARLPAAR
jgi:hypothetical protein